MPSAESRAIRATFTRDGDAVGVAPTTARQEWEAAAAQSALPAEVTVVPVHVAGLAGEWIGCADAAHDAVLLYIHGRGYNAGSCVTHRDLAARLAGW